MFIKLYDDQPETLNKISDLPDGVYRESCQSIFANADASLQLILIFYARDADPRPSVAEAICVEGEEMTATDFVLTGNVWQDGQGNRSEIFEELIPPRLLGLVEVQHVPENAGGLESPIVFFK
jgi:hypothetical protein